ELSLGRRPNFSVLVIHRVVLAKLTTRKASSLVANARTGSLRARMRRPALVNKWTLNGAGSGSSVGLFVVRALHPLPTKAPRGEPAFRSPRVERAFRLRCRQRCRCVALPRSTYPTVASTKTKPAPGKDPGAQLSRQTRSIAMAVR